MFQKIRPILVLIVLFLTFIVNSLANILPFNNQTTAQLSEKYSVLFTPANYVFLIWLVIYMALLGYGLYQIRRPQQKDSRLDKIGILFIISSIANSAWLFLWHYEYIYLSLVVMMILLFSLIGILLVGKVGLDPNVSKGWQLFVELPFSIYLGWISVATVANAAVVLSISNWNRFGLAESTWSMIMIAVVTLLTLLMILKRKNYAFALVIIWALVGIWVKYDQYQDIRNAVDAALLLILLTSGYSIRKNRQQINHSPQL